MRKEVMLRGLGMSRDVSTSKASSDRLYDAKNIRITVNDDDNSISITTEQSTDKVCSISGIILGSSVINDKAVIFAKDGDDDVIYLFKGDTPNISLTELFRGDIGFNVDYPIEAHSLFETSKIEKVYWVDGVNVPRVIMLNDKRLPELSRNTKHFDFPAHLDFLERVTIEKVYSGGGLFPSGVIQYFFTYYNRFGRETSIFHTSPLYYLTHNDRGAAPNETTSQVFKIKVDGLQSKDYDMLRVYSIHRTSINHVPAAYVVADLDISGKDSIEVIDDNRSSRSIEPTILHFLGSDSFVPYTMNSKDNTAFFGNYYNQRKEFVEYNVELNKGFKTNNKVLGGESLSLVVHPFKEEFFFDFNLHLSQEHISFFKKDELYRFAVHFQHRNGKWSNPVFIGEYSPEWSYSSEDGFYKPNMVTWDIPAGLVEYVKSKGYIRAQGLVCHPLDHERVVIAQGVLNPCVYNVGDRMDNSPYVQPSWFFRPNPPTRDLPKYKYNTLGPCIAEFRHNMPIGKNNSFNGEIANYEYDDIDPVNIHDHDYANIRSCRFAIDRSFVSMYTPETLNEAFSYTPDDVKLNVIGALPITKSVKKVEMSIENGPLGYSKDRPGYGFLKLHPYNSSNRFNEDAYKTLMNIPCYGEYAKEYADGMQNKINELLSHKDGKGWHSTFGPFGYYRFSDGPKKKEANELQKSVDYARENSMFSYIYPFHNTGGVGFNKFGENMSSKLKEKTLYNYRYSYSIKPIELIEVNISDSVYVNSSEDRLYQINHNSDKKFYRSFIDRMVTSSGHKDGKAHFKYRSYCHPVMPDNRYYESIIVGKNDYSNPVRVTYRNSKHILLSLNKTTLPGVYTSDSNVDSIYDGISITALSSALVRSDYEIINYNSLEGADKLDIFFDDFKSWSKDREFEVDRVEKPMDRQYKLVFKNEVPYIHKSYVLHHLKAFLESTAEMDSIGTQDRINNATIEWSKSKSKPAVLPDEYTISYEVFVEGKSSDAFFEYLWNEFKTIQDLWQKDDGKKVWFNIRTYDEARNGSVYHFYHNATIKDEELDAYTAPYVDYILDVFRNFSFRNISIYNWSNKSLEQDVWGSKYGYLLLGDLVRKNINRVNDLDEITFLPAGEPIHLEFSTTLPFTYGDYYYQRYNCLGTMALKDGMENNIVDVVSFMVETRQNINGIYDRNRASADFFNINEKNYSLMNSVYNQENNFFTYRVLNKELFDHGRYPNKVMWTKTKALGEEIDSWMHLTGVSSIDLDGKHDEIVSIQSNNNDIIAFQHNAIASIIFNPRVQIETSDGTPIEIANSGKVQGYRYISDNIGCQNKWTISDTNSGYIFIDDYSDVLYVLGGQGLQPLSESQGFRSYFDSRAVRGRYTPVNGGSISFYDAYRMDNYLVCSDGCLCLSGRLSSFESFFDYEATKSMFNIKERLYSLANGYIWKHRGNGFLSLHGEDRRFMLDWKVSADGVSDKVFTNLEADVDSYENGELKFQHNIESVDISTTYQEGSINLSHDKDRPSTMQKKFKRWGIDLPRERGSRNRIRDRWCRIRLTGNGKPEKTIIHNLKVTYYEQE